MKQDQVQRLSREFGERMRGDVPLEVGMPIALKLMLERLKCLEADIRLRRPKKAEPEND